VPANASERNIYTYVPGTGVIAFIDRERVHAAAASGCHVQ